MSYEDLVFSLKNSRVRELVMKWFLVECISFLLIPSVGVSY